VGVANEEQFHRHGPHGRNGQVHGNVTRDGLPIRVRNSYSNT
jgi:hypothetical protein